MDRLQNASRLLTSIQVLQGEGPAPGQARKLREQMKNFVHDIKNQFQTVVSGYQKTISNLKSQSQIPKTQSQIQKRSRNPSPMKHLSNSIIKINDQEQTGSPILPSRTNQFSRTTQSQFYKTGQTKRNIFPNWESDCQIKNISPIKKGSQQKKLSYFPEELSNPEYKNQRNFHRSRYERQNQNKKQRQQQIVHFLQSQKKNLDETTHKIMGLIGKGNKQVSNSKEGFCEQQNQQVQIKQIQEQHNRSLSHICESLDKSFVSQKARKSKLKRKKAEQEATKGVREQQIKNQKIRKQRAVKNLLSKLRQNANSINPPQILKSSKLIPTGQKTAMVFNPAQSMVLRNSSKVMINPVPVRNISAKKRDSSPDFSQKRPTSILKQSSNILTRSISGISAISFQE